MKKITLSGGKRLRGDVNVSGSKNAALPIIFACILTKGVSEITNLPDIGDVCVALDLLRSFGAEVYKKGDVTYIDTTVLSYVKPDNLLVSQIRASTYLIGSCLGRFGVCYLLPFGGCNFSKRPIDMHVDACLALGGELDGECLVADRLVGGEISFKKTSVGATVNAILLATCARGETLIRGGAREPHIDALIDFLISCGANINRRGDDLHITGGSLHGGKITVIGDMIEAGTYLALGLVTGGDVRVTNCPVKDMDAIFSALESIGATIRINGSTVTAILKDSGKASCVTATPYPGFPTDLQPIFAPIMASFDGGEITDTVWQSRFGYLEALSAFGIEYAVNGNHAKIVPSHIKSGTAVSPDLRGGMACLIAALVAEGKSVIYSAEIILRGYENLEKKLRALGAEVLIEDI